MSYASQQAFEALGELVEDLMERLEAAEARLEEQKTELDTVKEELASTKEELDDVRGKVGNVANAAMFSLSLCDYSLESIKHTMEMYTNLAEGEGGDAGDNVYTAEGFSFISSSPGDRMHPMRNMFDYDSLLSFAGESLGGTETLQIEIPHDRPVDAIVFKSGSPGKIRVEADGDLVCEEDVPAALVWYSFKVHRPAVIVMTFEGPKNTLSPALYDLMLFHFPSGMMEALEILSSLF